MWRARLWIPYGSMPIGLGVLTLQYVADLINHIVGREAALPVTAKTDVKAIPEGGA
jgi:TRAP-type C4-dicarboxylate transport system permease small subunit